MTDRGDADARDGADGTYRTRWSADEAPSSSVVEAVAAIEGVEPTSLDRLYDSVDPDALDALFEPSGDAPLRDGDGHVAFTFNGYRVTVAATGAIEIRRRSADADVTDEAAFEAALGVLVREAATNGVRVEGGWACGDASGSTEWGVEIYAVERGDRSR